MGTPRKMSFTITIDFSLRANYLAYSCAILALYQLIVQSINVPTATERLQSANEGRDIIKSSCCRDVAEKITAKYQWRDDTPYIIHIASRNGEVAARAAGLFELANEKLMHKFVTGAVAGALRPPDTAEMNLNFLIICRDNVPNMSPEARIEPVCPARTNKPSHLLIYMLSINRV